MQAGKKNIYHQCFRSLRAARSPKSMKLLAEEWKQKYPSLASDIHSLYKTLLRKRRKKTIVTTQPSFFSTVHLSILFGVVLLTGIGLVGIRGRV